MRDASTTTFSYFIFSIVILFYIPYSTTTSSLFALAGACQVTINDRDVTEEYFVVDDTATSSTATTTPYVNCMGHSKCRDAVIVNCPVVKCYDNEACNSAKIINFTDSVLCEGLHACHRTEITAAAGTETTVEVEEKVKKSTTFVSCVGSGSCDVAQFDRVDEITFSGVKAGRKVYVERSKLVKCRDGQENTMSCDSFATIETECLYCGRNGCANYINTCRYKILDDKQNDEIRYKKCQPETVIGTNCPDGIEEELQLELSGKEEIDVRNKDDDDTENETNNNDNDDNKRKKQRGMMRGLLRKTIFN